MPFSLTRLRSSPPYGSIPPLLLSHRSTPATLSGPLDPKKARVFQSLFTDNPPLLPPVQRAFCHRAQQGAGHFALRDRKPLRVAIDRLLRFSCLEPRRAFRIGSAQVAPLPGMGSCSLHAATGRAWWQRSTTPRCSVRWKGWGTSAQTMRHAGFSGCVRRPRAPGAQGPVMPGSGSEACEEKAL